MAMAVATAFSVNAFAADKTVSNINTAQTSKTTDGKTAKTVTYDEAVKLAIKNTSSIATIDEAMDYMKLVSLWLKLSVALEQHKVELLFLHLL